MKIGKIVLSAMIGYFLGSVNFSIVLSRSIGADIRTRGSGNAGATNIARIYGLDQGIVTFVCDFVKAIAAMLIARHLLGKAGVIIGGLASLLGHCYPVFYHFRGGKGISCGAAISLMLDWRIFLCLVVIFLTAAFASRKVSVGSIAVSAALPILTAAFGKGRWFILFAVVCSVIVLLRHRSNIERLIRGTEPDFRPGKR